MKTDFLAWILGLDMNNDEFKVWARILIAQKDIDCEKSAVTRRKRTDHIGKVNVHEGAEDVIKAESTRYVMSTSAPAYAAHTGHDGKIDVHKRGDLSPRRRR